MSLTSRQEKRQDNTKNKMNFPRRYILEAAEPSIHHQQQRNSLKRDHTGTSNQNRSSFSNQLSINDEIDDPWVKELLERDIDFSKLNPEERQVEILNISNRKSIPINFHHHQKHNFIKRSSQNDFVIEEKNLQKNQSLSPRNHPTTKWILQQPTNSNRFHSNQQKGYSTKYQIDEQKYLIQQQTNSFHSKQSQYNNHHKKVNSDVDEKSGIKKVWDLFSVGEKRNMLIYILGIMLYKFGLEAFNGSIVSLATNRYDRDALQSGIQPRTFEKVGLLVGLNQASQCIGSILISPLIKRYPTRRVLSISLFIFALFTALLMIIDAATGGRLKPRNIPPMFENAYNYYGKYPTNVLIPIYCLSGISYGMVELIRRIIPRDIVGTDEEKLERMDSLVHVFYEISGVSGALTTGLVLIPYLGNNYSFLITPILFSLSSLVCLFIKSSGINEDIPNDEIPGGNPNEHKNYLKSILKGFILFGESVYIGGKIIFTNRKYVWFFPCYSLTLYVHRYIENGIAPQIAKRYLNNSSWSQIIVGGSNFGELLGALSVFFLTKKVRSPLVWLRFDCLLLLIIWYIPYYNPSSISITNAWIISASFIPFGFGASGDDVSLNAHIQSILSKPQLKNKDVSSLGSVMAFLYSSYIVLYAILNPLLGIYIDSVYNRNQTIRPALVYTAGLQITIISILVALSTFIPKGSFKLNPSLD